MRRMPYAAVNGLTLYYEVHGYGPPLVLLHGGTASIPEKWIPLFTPHFLVIAPEQRGMGAPPTSSIVRSTTTTWPRTRSS